MTKGAKTSTYHVQCQYSWRQNKNNDIKKAGSYPSFLPFTLIPLTGTKKPFLEIQERKKIRYSDVSNLTAVNRQDTKIALPLFFQK